VVEEEPLDETPLAFIGVRACELNAIAIQDRVFTGGKFVDRDYAARRRGIFVVAVNCGEPAATCFCVSMDAGPRVEQGFDLALTEVLEGEHRFLVEAGSPAGAEVLAELASRPAGEGDLAAATAVVDSAAARMGRAIEHPDIRDLLVDGLEHPRWAEVAERCLTCGNCTMVCPTCFCSSVEDTSDLTGTETARTRVWDTCFSLDYSYIHGGSVRNSARSRYRQWLTHKLGTWHDQFDTSGCVGCGRCITWCPVGIDITEEVAALRAEEERDAHPA
jgi:ferredoxin